MPARFLHLVLIGWFGLAVFATAAPADEPPAAAPAVGSDDVARLEALLESQQKKLELLEQQVAASSQQDVNQARVQEMKQQIREILSEQEFRESLMPATVQAGYDDGFYIRSTDEKFKLRFNGQMQFRYTYYQTRDQNRYLAPGYRRHDRSGFDIARMNLDFSGNVYSKDLTYFIEISAASPGSYRASLSYAWVNYRIIDEFQIEAGLFRVANLRSNMVSNAQYQMVEAGLVDAVFGLNDAVGVRFWGQVLNKKVEYYVDVVNNINDTSRQTITNDEDYYTKGHGNTPAIVSRLVWHALQGACKGPMAPDSPARYDTPCDMEYSMDPALDIGMHYAFIDDWDNGTMSVPFPRKTFYRPGGFGLTSNTGLQINQIGVDAAFKYRGFSLTGEYVIRIQDVSNSSHAPYTPLYQLTGDDSTNAQHGAYVQAGYFLPIPGWENKFEVAARVGGVSTLAGGAEGTWEYAGGLNYYIQGHKVKLQTDVVKISEAPISNSTYTLANVNDDVLMWRVQLQVAF